jgi:hypothetical protein
MTCPRCNDSGWYTPKHNGGMAEERCFCPVGERMKREEFQRFCDNAAHCRRSPAQGMVEKGGSE